MNDDNGLVEIKKIYLVDIGDGKKDVVLQLKKWNVFKIFGKVTNRRICLKSSKISTKSYGKLTTKSKDVTLLRSEAEMKEAYKGKDLYTSCRSLIKEAYKCAKDSNCDVKDKGLYKKYYQECSDKKLNLIIKKGLKEVHSITGEYYDAEKDSYPAAFKKVLGAVRKLEDGVVPSLKGIRRYL